VREETNSVIFKEDYSTMDINTLHNTINNYTPDISSKARQEIFDLCEEQIVSGGQMITEPGKWDGDEYILINGILRIFLLNTEGEEITLTFYEEFSTLIPHIIRTENGKSLYYVQAVTDCTLLKMDAEGFRKLMVHNPDVREFGHAVLRQELANKVNKEIRMASWTAGERLEAMRKEYSMLENFVPHTMIASYLGITPISLSRLRKSPSR